MPVSAPSCAADVSVCLWNIELEASIVPQVIRTKTGKQIAISTTAAPERLVRSLLFFIFVVGKVAIECLKLLAC